LQSTQDRSGLVGKWNDVLLSHLDASRWDTPLGVVEVELGPFRRAQLTGANENIWREFEGRDSGGLSHVSVNGAQQLIYCSGTYCRREVGPCGNFLILLATN
jgi:hypothetical protein